MSKAPLKQLSVNTFERTRIVSPKKSSKESNIQRKKVEEPHDERYWRTMAEFYRTKLDEITRENQQLHEIVDNLNKDNEHLRVIADHCEYLTNLIEKLTTDEPTDQSNRSTVRTRLF